MGQDLRVHPTAPTATQSTVATFITPLLPDERRNPTYLLHVCRALAKGSSVTVEMLEVF